MFGPILGTSFSRGQPKAPATTLTVLNSSGQAFDVPVAVLDSDGNSFSVLQSVRASDGTPYAV